MADSAVPGMLRIVLDDTRRVLRALKSVIFNRWREDRVDLCLGILSSGQSLATPGKRNEYSARLMNPRGRSGTVRLVLDVCEYASSLELRRHLGFSVADVSLHEKPSRELRWQFDWEGGVELELDGEKGRPLAFTPGDTTEVTQRLWQLTLEVRDPTTDRTWHSLSIVEAVGARRSCES